MADTSGSISYSDGAKLPPTAPDWAVAASERLKKRREEGYQSSCTPPPGVKNVLLHSCCAPCSGAMVEEMCSSPHLDRVVVFFYNPNIHPRKEYEIRKEVGVMIDIICICQLSIYILLFHMNIVMCLCLIAFILHHYMLLQLFVAGKQAFLQRPEH